MKSQSKTGHTLLEKARRLTIPTWFFLWSAAIVYTYKYLAHPALPGNNFTYPEGWWGWFDQSQYLLSAKSWLAGDFAPAHHYYPPLYPVIGALFYRWLPVHPYFLFNAAAFVGFIYVFLKFSSRYVTRVETFLIVAIAVYFNGAIMENFVIPWSTAGSIAIYSAAILMLHRLDISATASSTKSNPLVFLSALFFSAVFGLLAILRPVDAGLATVFFPAYLLLQFRCDRPLPGAVRFKRVALTCAALGLGLTVGLGLFAIYNTHVFGSALGGYINSTATSSGYYVFQLPRKAFSILFDANTVFLEQGASIVTHYPWVLLSLIGLMVFVIRGDVMLRILALAIVFHFCLYAPYGDLLPNGIWRYKNIHYFKWTFPYLMLFAWLLFRWVFGATGVTHQEKASLRVRSMRIATIGLLGIALCSLKFSTQETAIATTLEPDGSAIKLQIDPKNAAGPIDFIDLKGLEGGFTDIYFGEHHLTIDGQSLAAVRDFRLVPAPWGARLLMIHPLSGREITFVPGKTVKVATAGLKSFVGSYHLSIGKPRIRRDFGCPFANPACSPS